MIFNMNNALDRLLKMFKKKESCEHDTNYIDKRYLVNNTPYVKFTCLDCMFQDEGPVFGPSEDWEETIIVRKGIKGGV